MPIDILNKWSSPPDQAALDFLCEAVTETVALRDCKFKGDLIAAIEAHRSEHGAPLLAKMHGQDLGLRDDATDVSAILPAGFVEALPGALRDLMRREDRLVGIPVGLHRANSLFVSRPALDKLGIALPRTLEAWIAAVRKLADSGAAPLAIGTDPMLLGFLFENLAIAAGGARYHRAAFVDIEDEALRCTTTLEIAELWSDILRTSRVEDRPWRELGAEVRRGEAAFFACGDFASSYMLEDAERAGVVEIAFPGTADAFVFIADFFTPIGFASDAELASLMELAERWSTPETVRGFCRRKGALPPVGGLGEGDASSATLAKQDACRTAIANAAFIPSMTLEQAAPHRVRAAILDTLMAQATSDEAPQAIQAALAEAVAAARKPMP